MGFAGFALKPILMREIAQTVRQSLDNSLKNKKEGDGSSNKPF
jgi:hypothetical protein